MLRHIMPHRRIISSLFHYRKPKQGGIQFIYGGDGQINYGIKRELADNIRAALRNIFKTSLVIDL